MNNLINLIIYILKIYPKPEELSKPRLVKLIYLIDWKYTIDNKKQYTNIEWFFNHYGPYVDDVINIMKNTNDIFEVKSYPNPYSGGFTDKFQLKNNSISYELDNKIQETANYIINNTYKMNWDRFIALVYSTYPIKINSKFSKLNLVELATQFKQHNKTLERNSLP